MKKLYTFLSLFFFSFAVGLSANLTDASTNETKQAESDLNEIVVSASRSEQKRIEAPIIVSTISPKLLSTVQAVTLSEGLNFSPGLRLENNCQNCGFTQVRMNGMEGPYTQLLINSRPIISGLAGVYGLELLPTNMIERIEVVRGGGSALFGSNAIAGTINLILKEPHENQYAFGSEVGLNGLGVVGSAKASTDYHLHFNTSLVSDDKKTGLSLYAFTRGRGMFDANHDGFSEIAPQNNQTFGARFFQRMGHNGKFSADFFSINEQRDGGNKQDLPLHERDVAEAVKHDLKVGSMTYDQLLGDHLFSAFASAQFLNRDSYYGANQSLKDYGKSGDQTVHAGVQLKTNWAAVSMISGIEGTAGMLKDQKLGYPDLENAQVNGNTISVIPHVANTLVSDQSSITLGAFTQAEWQMNRLKWVLGGRLDRYQVMDHAKANVAQKVGVVFSPRLSMMYRLAKPLQARFNYAQGYRAPQIFDEDLHIETSGSRQVINVNDPNLKKETSHSYTLSLDYNTLLGTTYVGLLMEGFLTRLNHPFVNEIGTPDAQGIVYYMRKNAEDGATVQGVNWELKVKPAEAFSVNAGFTWQSSRYDVPQEFNEKRFFRTPDTYGFMALDWDFTERFCLSATGNYTGNMLVPYFGPDADPVAGALRTSKTFFDLGLSLKYQFKWNSADIQCYVTSKNLLNAYQPDYDRGIDRDPSYMYGPVQPRSLSIGFKIGNIIN